MFLKNLAPPSLKSCIRPCKDGNAQFTMVLLQNQCWTICLQAVLYWRNINVLFNTLVDIEYSGFQELLCNGICAEFPHMLTITCNLKFCDFLHNITTFRRHILWVLCPRWSFKYLTGTFENQGCPSLNVKSLKIIPFKLSYDKHGILVNISFKNKICKRALNFFSDLCIFFLADQTSVFCSSLVDLPILIPCRQGKYAFWHTFLLFFLPNIMHITTYYIFIWKVMLWIDKVGNIKFRYYDKKWDKKC